MDSKVAYVGEGSGDAPVLKIANVGFSLGRVGTDVAKDACDIIVLDDSFSSVIKSFYHGRINM